MKAVLRSIKPYWFYLICEGLKTIEVGKTAPKSKDWNKSVELYCSKDIRSFNRIPKKYQDKYRHFLGKIWAQFVCDRVDEYTFSNLEAEYRINDIDIAKTCLNHSELIGYGKGKSLYGWHISELKIYDKPKELGEFYRSLPEKVLENGDYDCRKEWDVVCIDAPEGGDYCAECPYGGRVQITRPPQSWCFVEELK